jgi:diphosphoinositol-polyphosphate diphosphatase
LFGGCFLPKFGIKGPGYEPEVYIQTKEHCQMSSDSSLEPPPDAVDDPPPSPPLTTSNASTPPPPSDSDAPESPESSTAHKSISFGRIKEPPSCKDESMRALATPTEELRKHAFPQLSNTFGDQATPTAVMDNTAPSPAVIIQSRQGRQHQRWKPGGVRQVTGCVPILQNSQILLISASRKNTWILPKGGWELDETMAESAVRETYEEAGVTGCLRRRPLHPPITCPSRKSDSPVTEVSFFCLYVQHVADDWPENGRLRRAVSIETALELVRPEFRSLLTQVKTQFLHWPNDTDVISTDDEGTP